MEATDALNDYFSGIPFPDMGILYGNGRERLDAIVLNKKLIRLSRWQQDCMGRGRK